MADHHDERERIDGPAESTVSRRRILRSSAVTIGGLGAAATASASADDGDRPCEQVVPDLAIHNRDDRPRLVTVAVESGRSGRPVDRRTMRLDAGDRRTIDDLSSTPAGQRVRATVDGDDDAVRGLDALRPDGFKRGFRMVVDSGEIRAEPRHVDLPPRTIRELRARCEE